MRAANPTGRFLEAVLHRKKLANHSFYKKNTCKTIKSFAQNRINNFVAIESMICRNKIYMVMVM
jgi:hypothetical protein